MGSTGSTGSASQEDEEDETEQKEALENTKLPLEIRLEKAVKSSGKANEVEHEVSSIQEFLNKYSKIPKVKSDEAIDADGSLQTKSKRELQLRHKIASLQ